MPSTKAEIESVRLQIELDRATVIAYIFTMTNIVMLWPILELKSQYRYFLFLLAALSGFAAIAYTETRAALLTFPVLIILLLIVHPRVRKNNCSSSVQPLSLCWHYWQLPSIRIDGPLSGFT